MGNYEVIMKYVEFIKLFYFFLYLIFIVFFIVFKMILYDFDILVVYN